jgi:hypothetical protein
MSQSEVPEHILQLNARIKADPSITENMGPVHVLAVPGRLSGELRSTPVSPLDYDGARWLVCGFSNADWPKNLRASGWATLTKGTRAERITTVEVPLAERAPVLRAFIQEHAGAGRGPFDVPPDAPLEQFAAAAERVPMFRIVATEPVA